MSGGGTPDSTPAPHFHLAADRQNPGYRFASLRFRTALATVISVMLIMAMLLLAYRVIVRDAYRELDNDRAVEELQRTKSVLRAEQQSLDVLLTDWASWDDMYAFVVSRSPAFVSSNHAR